MSDPRHEGVDGPDRFAAPWAIPAPARVEASAVGVTGRPPRMAPAPDAATPGPQDPDAAAPQDPAAAVPAPRRPRDVRRRVEGLSLRARLLGILVVALLAALTVTGYGVQLVLERYLVQQLDGDLRANYVRASQDVRFIDGLLNGISGNHGPPTSFATYVNVPSRPDLTVGRAPRPDVAMPVWPATMTFAQAKALRGRIFSLQDAKGVTWRAVAMPAIVQQTAADGTSTSYESTIVLALSTEGVGNAVDELRLGTLVLGLGVIGAVAVVGWFAIRRSFRPLVEVEETAAAIAAGDLSRRVPERPASTEVGRLTSSLNGMLTRIESAFRAQEASEARTRRFAADASHELRTPLVSIRGFAELYRQGAVPPDEVPRTMRRIEDEAKRMGSLVEDLLLLARLDAQRPGRSEPVDLAVLAGDAVHDARGLDAGRQVTLVGLNGHGPAAAVVTGDEDRLRQVVANLVANAVRHTPAATPIEVAVGVDGAPDRARAVLEVRDHGQGLTPEQAAKVFERFYRIDSSRRRDTGGGSGLGLSIVSAVVASHAGEVEVRQTPGGGATFRMSLPLRTADAEQATAER